MWPNCDKHHPFRWYNIAPSDCKVNEEYSVDGICYKSATFTKNVVLTSTKPIKVDLRMAEKDFKNWCYKHNKQFKNRHFRNNAKLSKYIWEIWDKYNEDPAHWNGLSKKVFCHLQTLPKNIWFIFKKNWDHQITLCQKIIEETFGISSQKLSVTQVFTLQIEILRLSML